MKYIQLTQLVCFSAAAAAQSFVFLAQRPYCSTVQILDI